MRKYFLILALIGLLLYLPSLSGPFLWDDEDFVYANQYVANFQIDKFFTECATCGRGKLSNYYRPVPQIVYATTHSIFGFNPSWFHLINVLTHIAAASTIFYFFYLLLNNGIAADIFARREGKLAAPVVPTIAAEQEKNVRRQMPWLSLFIALFFLIHPVQTEAVSYISGLSDPLYVLFGFLSLISFFEKKTTRSVFFLALSLLSKETAIVFLPLMLLLNYRKTLPHILVTVFYLLFHFTQINKFDIVAAWGNNPYSHSLLVRLLTFAQNLYTYLGLLLFPKDLFMERDFSTAIQTNLNWSILGLLAALAIVFYLVRKNKFLVFCFLAFFISFLPYTGIVLINGTFYEHFLYLPLVFFFGFLVFLAAPFLHRRSVIFIIVIILIFLGLRNIARQLDWSDAIRFYSQTLAHAPKSIRIINGLGIAYADRGDLDSAITTYQQGITVDPKVPNLYHNLANTYLAQGATQSAEINYLKAIEVDPNFIFSWQSLANLYQQTGQKDQLDALIAKYQMLNKK